MSLEAIPGIKKKIAGMLNQVAMQSEVDLKLHVTKKKLSSSALLESYNLGTINFVNLLSLH